MRWLLVGDDVVSADWLASELRRAGSVVRLVDAAGLELSRLANFDAQVLLASQGLDLRFLQERLTRHPGLRWAVPLFVRYPDPWQESSASFIPQLQESAAQLVSADRELEALARKPPRSFAAPIERMGPVRVLRALCTAHDVFRVRFASAQHQASVDIAANLVLGAVFEQRGEPTLFGAEALACVLELSEGRATVEHRPSLNAPMLSLSIDRALERAYAEVRERRASSDADSPTRRIRSPLLRMSRSDVVPALVPDGTDTLAPDLTSDSKADTKLVELSPQFLHYVPTSSGVVVRPPHLEQPAQAAELLAPRVLADTEEITVARHSDARAYLRLTLFAAALALLTFGVTRLLGLPRAAEVRHAESKVATPHLPIRPASVGVTQAPVAAAKVAPSAPGRLSQARAPLPEPANTEHEANSPARESAQALMLAAERALKQGDIEAALKLAERALLLRPRRVTYVLLYGDALVAAGKPEAALEQFRVALERQPRSRAIERRIAALTPGAE